MKKISNIARKMDTTLKIMYWLAVAGGVLGCGQRIWAMFALRFLPETHITGGFTMEAFSVRLTPERIPAPPFGYWINGVQILMLVLTVPAVCRAINIVRRILSTMIHLRPFDQSIPDSLRKLAWISVFLGIVLNLIGIAGDFLLFHIPSLLAGEGVAGIGLNVDLDLSFLLITAVLLLLSCVFSYGQTLQQQSDETL